MLGFSSNGATAVKYSTYGSVSTNFIMDNVNCDGTENTLEDCSYFPTHNCGSTEGAGVICRSFDITLVGGSSGAEGNVLYQGRPIWYDAQCISFLILFIFCSSVMTPGMIEMLRLCVGCLDLVEMVQLLYYIPPMVLLWTILSWMMSTVMVQRILLKIALTALQIIVAKERELGSFVLILLLSN